MSRPGWYEVALLRLIALCIVVALVWFVSGLVGEIAQWFSALVDTAKAGRTL